MNEPKRCPFCGEKPHSEEEGTVMCSNDDCLMSVYGVLVPVRDWNSRPIEYALQKRIAYLEEQLRWRPVWEQPEKSGYYEVEFDNGNFHDMIFYNEHSSWRCSQEHVNITGWRPIPELELKGE